MEDKILKGAVPATQKILKQDVFEASQEAAGVLVEASKKARALVENAQGQVWLLMMNLDMFIQHPRFDPALKADAVRIRDMLLEIMAAGAAGDW